MIPEVLKAQLAFVHYSVQKNLDGIEHQDSLARPEHGGNSINWVLGHMVSTRNRMLALLGGESIMDAAGGEPYARYSKGVGAGSECTPLEELTRLYDASQTTLMEKLDSANDALFAREVPGLFDADKRESTGVQLAALVFHEAYHAGQIGVIRRAIGKDAAIA